MNNLSTHQIGIHLCDHCGTAHKGVCLRVKAIEYHPDGTVKRIEYHAITPLTGEKPCETLLSERLQAIIDWADLALANPTEFNAHGVKNLDGPVFDAARAALSPVGVKP